MPYRQIEFRADQYYHVYNRGNNFQLIFFARENYLYFLRLLRKYLLTEADMVAYCLMPNHYHLLLFLKKDELSSFMQPLSLAYTKSINKRFGRAGSLFQGPFKAIHVERDEYLLHLSRYIHLNPFVAGLVTRAEDWEFSSYREYLGLRPGTLPKPGPVLSQFSSTDAYRKFVEEGVRHDRIGIEHLAID